MMKYFEIKMNNLRSKFQCNIFVCEIRKFLIGLREHK